MGIVVILVYKFYPNAFLDPPLLCPLFSFLYLSAVGRAIERRWTVWKASALLPFTRRVCIYIYSLLLPLVHHSGHGTHKSLSLCVDLKLSSSHLQLRNQHTGTHTHNRCNKDGIQAKPNSDKLLIWLQLRVLDSCPSSYSFSFFSLVFFFSKGGRTRIFFCYLWLCDRGSHVVGISVDLPRSVQSSFFFQ